MLNGSGESSMFALFLTLGKEFITKLFVDALHQDWESS